VDVAYDGQEGLEKAMKNNYSLIILDIILPKKDGFAICRDLRAHQIHTPIIMLTARGSEENRVEGLDAGADDYLVKPFGLTELFARIRAVLRRRKIAAADIVKFGNFLMDKRKHEVTYDGKVISLTPKEYKLLDLLVTNKEQAITRRELIDKAWGPEFAETNNELNVHINYLRKKLEKVDESTLVHTIRGVGFMLKE
jgi:two-component system alkaline phosphatase synthesis response regulator PhoP